MKPLVISAPFGNWITSEHATSTLGTYTVQNRSGVFPFPRWYMLWRILYTLRYRPAVGGWTNKLGLPSPGVRHLEKIGRTVGSSPSASGAAANLALHGKIVSLNGFNREEWIELISRTYALGAMPSGGMCFDMELNVSCPNVGHLSIPKDLFESAVQIAGADSLIAKLPPVSYLEAFELAYAAGVRRFHATNTLPVPAGGLSGKALKRVSLDVVKRLKDLKPDITIIGGGGITTPDDVADFRRAGATHVAVASALLKPTRGWFKGPRERFLKEIAEAARSIL